MSIIRLSAFNTMQPHTLINRLAEYNIPARLQLFVLDFLTDRKQYVRTEIELSSTTSINTGAPQGCVLSAFLFIIYTNALSLCSTMCKIIKYADDTVVIGLINNDNEQEYRDTVSYVSSWCNENHLNLNAGKTKEMIFDFRKIQNDNAQEKHHRWWPSGLTGKTIVACLSAIWLELAMMGVQILQQQCLTIFNLRHVTSPD